MLARTTTNCLILLQNEPDWMLQFRLKAYRQWLTMEEPKWSDNTYTPINYQKISYYSEPKFKEKKMSLDEVDPELLRTFDKLGIPLNEQKRLSNVAVDAVFDSVSIATTFRADLMKAGVIFCSISEAVKEYPELVKKHMGSVVSGDAHGLHGGLRAHASMHGLHAWPLLRRDRAANAACTSAVLPVVQVPVGDNYFTALNSAVFSDGSFVYIPKGVRSPMELSTYFRINASETGQARQKAALHSPLLPSAASVPLCSVPAVLSP